ncbi:MAG: ribonuclease HII [Acidimicrobiales bacterium]|nr:ribonuclease HII [Acidimicrobiales bacterium]
MAKRESAPIHFEKLYCERGIEHIGGIDEVGRGAYAGPVAVGVVVPPRIKEEELLQEPFSLVNDSKLLTPKKREIVAKWLLTWLVDYGVGFASPQECDEFGMTKAISLAGHRAMEKLKVIPETLLTDGNRPLLGLECEKPIVKGDQLSFSIASASILAKVTRDSLLCSLSVDFPAYDFDRNKGYNSKAHQIALLGYGPSSIHRISWGFINDLPWHYYFKSSRSARPCTGSVNVLQ